MLPLEIFGACVVPFYFVYTQTMYVIMSRGSCVYNICMHLSTIRGKIRVIASSILRRLSVRLCQLFECKIYCSTC